MTDSELQSIAFLRENCPAYQKQEAKTRQLVGDMISCMNSAVCRMRNAESVKEADEAYLDVLKATARLVKELPANKE